jgi:fatty acid desaturase
MGAMKSHHYWKQVDAFKQELREAVPHDVLKALHQRSGPRHLGYAARQFAIIAACGYALWHVTNPLLWGPLAILQGFTFFNMTTLLHEVVHRSVFARSRPLADRVLGLVYASTSGISASQFTRWHLDHHDNLGSWEDDPKRHWLSPKRNARWYKLLYCTPALIPIYFRAAAGEARSYPRELRRTIALERLLTVAFQLAVASLLGHFGGWGVLARVWAVPYFLVFPVAFTLNRLGQHYDIDPSHPLKWSTLMAPSRTWDFLFVYSNYHAEHHYFPSVPFYNLRKLHLQLRPLYARLGLKSHTYREIAWEWFVRNRPPHADWDAAAPLAEKLTGHTTA